MRAHIKAMDRVVDIICQWFSRMHTAYVENMVRRQHTDWENMVKAIDSKEKYRWTVRCMFEDGKLNNGRLLVLDVFTRDVCSAHPTIANQVLLDHVTFKRTCRL